MGMVRIIPQAKDRSTALWWDIMILWKMLWNISQEKFCLLDYQKKILGIHEQVPNGWDNRVIYEFVTGAQ